MTLEQAQKLQGQITHESIVLLTLFQTDIDISHHEKSIPLIGKAWGIPESITQQHLANLSQQMEYAKKGTSASVYPTRQLQPNASGPKIMETIWWLFETSVKLGSEAERQEILEMAVEYALSQNFDDKIRE